MMETAERYEIQKAVDYHSRSELSSSEIACYLTDPIAWYHRYCLRDWQSETTEAMRFGTTVHRMIELGGSDAIVRQIPQDALNADGHCKGKQWTEWKAANPAEVYLKPGEPNPLKTIWNNLQANEWCRTLINHSEKEVEHFWYDEDLSSECRMKADAMCGLILVDWKTTSKTDARTFAQDAAARFYDVRLAFYRRGFRDKYGCNPDVFVVAINTIGGCKVTPYRMPNEWLDDAEARLLVTVDEMSNFSLDRYLDCGPTDLVQPRWSTFDVESISDE